MVRYCLKVAIVAFGLVGIYGSGIYIKDYFTLNKMEEKAITASYEMWGRTNVEVSSVVDEDCASGTRWIVKSIDSNKHAFENEYCFSRPSVTSVFRQSDIIDQIRNKDVEKGLERLDKSIQKLNNTVSFAKILIGRG